MTRRLPARLEAEREKLVRDYVHRNKYSFADIGLLLGVSESMVRRVLRQDLRDHAEALKFERVRQRMAKLAQDQARPTPEEEAEMAAAQKACGEARMRVEMAERIARARREEAELNRIYDEMTSGEEGMIIQ